MHTQSYAVIVIGAGQAGLSASYYLNQAGRDHLVLERGQIGESWRSQRWDNFMLNTAHKLNTLPGYEDRSQEPDGFGSATELAHTLADYVRDFQLPVVEQAQVLSVTKSSSSGLFEIRVYRHGQTEHYTSHQVILASGSKSEPKRPAFALNLASDIRQLHAGQYRHASQLPAGAVLVVGGAQSGCQIAADLVQAGRQVYLATSRVGRVPRHYRGQDIMDWLVQVGFFEARAQDIPDPAMRNMKPPQLTGTEGGRHTLSLQALARQGVTLLGKLSQINGRTVFFEANAPAHVQFADAFSAQVKQIIDGFIAQNQLSCPAPEPDLDDQPDPSCASHLTSLDLAERDVTTVIWATGFGGDYSYVNLPILDPDGYPTHRRGVSDVPGLYVLGMDWLQNRKSALLLGISADARLVVETLLSERP